MGQKYAGVIYYNDTPLLLEKCLKSLKPNFKIITVDGAFQEWPREKHEKFYSTDGCIDVAKELADINIDAPKKGWVDQAMKRNQYFRNTPVGSYCFSVDADELMQPFEWGMELADDVYRITQLRFHEDGSTLGPFGTVRCYKIYPDLAYKYRHCTIYRLDRHKEGDLKSGLVTCAKGKINQTRKKITDADGKHLLVHNRRDLRSPGKQAQKAHYKENRKEWEYRRQLNDF